MKSRQGTYHKRSQNKESQWNYQNLVQRTEKAFRGFCVNQIFHDVGFILPNIRKTNFSCNVQFECVFDPLKNINCFQELWEHLAWSSCRLPKEHQNLSKNFSNVYIAFGIDMLSYRRALLATFESILAPTY